jgi:CheY-like chemotaxis protein
LTSAKSSLCPSPSSRPGFAGFTERLARPSSIAIPARLCEGESLTVASKMNYQLSFFDDAPGAQDVWEANFSAEHMAICWMWLAGGMWAQQSGWSTMELWCRRCADGRIPCPRAQSAAGGRCCIARIPAAALRQDPALLARHRARPIVLILERDCFSAAIHKQIITAAGCSAVSVADCASAGKWLSANNPDAAIIDVKPADKSCTELASKLAQREIPFLAVSHYSAASPGIDQIFQAIVWLAKPVASAGLQLALRSML